MQLQNVVARCLWQKWIVFMRTRVCVFVCEWKTSRKQNFLLVTTFRSQMVVCDIYEWKSEDIFYGEYWVHFIHGQNDIQFGSFGWLCRVFAIYPYTVVAFVAVCRRLSPFVYVKISLPFYFQHTAHIQQCIFYILYIILLCVYMS